MIVVEEGKEAKDRENEEEHLCGLGFCTFFLDVKGQEAANGKDEEDDSRWICCEETVADNEGNEQRLHEQQFIVQFNEGILIYIVIILVALFLRSLLLLLLFDMLTLLDLTTVLVLFFFLLFLLLLLIIEAIDQLIFLLILVLLLVFLGMVLDVLFVDIWYVLEPAVFDLFHDPEDGEREVCQKEEEEAELEEKRRDVEGFGESCGIWEVVYIGDAFVGCKEETLECEVNHFLQKFNQLRKNKQLKNTIEHFNEGLQRRKMQRLSIWAWKRCFNFNPTAFKSPCQYPCQERTIMVSLMLKISVSKNNILVHQKISLFAYLNLSRPHS